ncbi:helix-turn-helix domain-containing protein [Haladaptatus pallidirubidus]|uniref:HTH bat-type domain-containing protein n=1 Tax=Haladaptatus pallidirubidus TaxID=1008152 RepID=A0AAV3UGY3_9EURY|nr:helix-turn-helix domain-containing protein [Haladaptatus pallidirubidus]
MPEVELKLKPSNEEIAAVSRDYPDVEFQLLDSYRIKEETLMSVLFEIQTTNPVSVVESFDEMTELHSYEILHTGETVVLIRCLIDEPAPSHAARASNNLVKPPLVLRNGWIFATFTASDENISQFKDELESAGVTYRVISIGQPSDPIDRLTKRQREVLDEAVDRGYYETPRECSITELAIGLGVTKGTMSRVLHRAESTIIKDVIYNYINQLNKTILYI